MLTLARKLVERFQRGSIATSLFLLSAGWLIVALVATAFLLSELYSRALDTSLTETLEFHIETLTDLTLLSRYAQERGDQGRRSAL